MTPRDERPWIGQLPGEQYECVITGTRAGMRKLRVAIDEVLEKKEVDISEFWDDYSKLRLVDAAPSEEKTKMSVWDRLQLCGAILTMLFLVASLIVGMIQIFRWMR
jgi:hypothetical protein